MYKNIKNWHDKIEPLISSKYGKWLEAFLKTEWKNYDIIPKNNNEFLKVFKITPFPKIKVVFIATTPYTGYVSKDRPVFDGLPFSNTHSFSISPSLEVIFKEIERTYDIPISMQDRNLAKWSNQGVFLFNIIQTILNRPTSDDLNRHKMAWDNFTKYIFKILNTKNDLIWVFLGNNVATYSQYITNTSHKILKYGHPDPRNISNSFLGSCCFLEINKKLKNLQKDEIIWG